MAGLRCLDLMSLAVEQGRAITEALVSALPEDEAAIRARFEQVTVELTALDSRLMAAARRLDSVPLLFSHPIYQYLAARYRLDARSLHWEPDVNPSESEWVAFEALLVEHPRECCYGKPNRCLRRRRDSRRWA